MATTSSPLLVIEGLASKMRNDEAFATLWERDAISDFIAPVLDAYGWTTRDPALVEREYRIGFGRVDFLLKGPASLAMLLEAKRPSQNLRDHERQILLYAFEEGMPLAVLTNARQWWFYLAMEAGPWRSRKFCEIDLVHDPMQSVVTKFDRFLSRAAFSGGAIERDARDALTAWRADHPVVEPPKEESLDVDDLTDSETTEAHASSAKTYPNPHAHGTKMRQTFEALSSAWVTGDYLTDLTGQKGGWPRWVQKHYVESGRYGEVSLLWKKNLRPRPMHLVGKDETNRLLRESGITIYPD